MTDVENYGKLIGATPKPGPDGWFPGRSEEEKAASRFFRYVSKVWIYENPVPDLAVDLMKFDSEIWREAERKYESDGGKAHLGLDGGTLFETWAIHQLFKRERYSVLLSETASSTPIDNITRVTLLAPSELVSVIEILLPAHDASDFNQEIEIPALMNIGNAGHVIRLRSRSSSLEEIRYVDPWPGPSLLCDANNKLGIRAKLMQQKPLRWGITREEFERATCALIVPTLMLSSTRYGEQLCPYETLKQGDLFGFFRLREKGSFRVSELLRVQQCVTKAEGHEVRVEFFVDDEGMVRKALISVDPSFAATYAPLLADLMMHLMNSLDAKCGIKADRAAMLTMIRQTMKAGKPAYYAGAIVRAGVGFVEENGETHIVVDVLPA